MKKSLIWGGGILMLLVCMGFLGASWPVETAFRLAVGWVFFLVRVVPNITVNWASVLTAAMCVPLLAVGLHWFLGWLTTQVQNRRGVEEAQRQRWRPRWTGAMLTLVVLAFVAGTAVVGVAHQSVWLVTSPEAMFGGREAYARVRSQNNLKQIGLACHNYNDVHGQLPAGSVFDAHGTSLHGWQTALLPHVEEDALFNKVNQTVPWDHPSNAEVFRTHVKVYQNPRVQPTDDQHGYSLSHYAGNVHLLGARPLKFDDVSDGLANTILAGEVGSDYRPWGQPRNWRDPSAGLNRGPDSFGSPRPGEGVNILMADGSVRVIKPTVSPTVLNALGTPRGNEPLSSQDW